MKIELIELLGGKENIIKSEKKDELLHVFIKDAGLVNSLKIKEMITIESVQMKRNRVIISFNTKKSEGKNMSKNYSELADKIITLVGGKENVNYFTHCVTRLRFTIKNKSLVSDEEIKTINEVIGVNWSGNQLQVIVGPIVSEVYDAICRSYDFKKEDMIEEVNDAKKKSGVKEKFLDFTATISACLYPMINIFVAAGLLKVLLILLLYTPLITETSSTYLVLSFAADAAFYFMPIYVGAAAAKRFNSNIYIAMFLCAMLISPTFITYVTSGTELSLFGLPVYAGSYASTLFPSIMVVFVMSHVERFIEKHSPAIIKDISVPFLTILVMIPLTLCVLAPLGSVLGTYLSDFIMWLYDKTGIIAIVLFAFLYPIMVITGMHAAIVPVIFGLYATLGYEPFLWLCIVISNTNQGVATLVVSLRSKNRELKTNAMSSTITAIVAGVTEPALFGVNLKLRTPLIAAMIGNAAGAIVLALTKVIAYQIVMGGVFFTVTGFVGENSMNVIFMIASVVVGAVVTAIITRIIYNEKNEI